LRSPLDNHKIAIVSYDYPIETSPTIINLSSYLVDAGYQTDLIIGELIRSRSFNLPNVRIIKLKLKLLGSRFWRYFRKRFNKLMKLDNKLFCARLKKITNNYDCVICIEFWSLDAVVQAGYDLRKCVYLSLEGTACTRPFDIRYVKDAIAGCSFSIITSKEQGRNLEKHFEMPIDFEYVPVSIRPPANLHKISNNRGDRRGLHIIQSGYFAEWSCLSEFIDAFKRIDLNSETRLCLHGHKIGTEKYFKHIISKTRQMGNVYVNLSYYHSDRYLQFLSQFDIGLAFYKNYINSPDWENLIFSSGKIASYLWVGLAVLTNISHPLTLSPPFLYVEPSNPEQISQAIVQYSVNPKIYYKSAFEIARKYYNMDSYMDKIIPRIDAICR
jgi:hypothetical protein